MAKAMLIMDEMPTTCSECKLCGFDGVCHAVHEFCQYRFDKKQEWCPLREVPSKHKDGHTVKIAIENDCFDGFEYEKGYCDGKDAGYNTCIDEILGGGE